MLPSRPLLAALVAGGALLAVTTAAHVETMGHFTGDGHSADCSGTTAYMIDAGTEIRPAGSQAIVSSFGGLAWTWNCTGSDVPSGLAMVNLKDASGAVPLDAIVALPDASSPATVVRDVSRTVEGAQCPLYSQSTLSCTAHVAGTVTFTRTGERDGAPTPPPVRDPQPGSDDPGTRIIDLIPGRTDLSRDARHLHVKVHCGEYRCRPIRLDVFRYNTGGFMSVPGARHARRISTRRLSLASGTSTRVAINFNKKARKLIKRGSGVRIVVTTRSVRRTLAVRLPHRTAGVRSH